MKLPELVTVLSLCAALGSCGGRSTKAPNAGSSLASKIALVDGDAEAKSGGGWSKLDAPRSGIAELRSKGGAVLVVAEGRGKLWIAAGSDVAIGEQDGRIRLVVLTGKVRFRGLDPNLAIDAVVGSDTIPIGARDVVLEARDGKVGLLDTAKSPQAADWAFRLDAPGEAGIGSLETKAADGARTSLVIRSLKIDAKRKGDWVETSIEHVFHNPGAERTEGTFRFPLPQYAVPIGLAMEIDGKLMEGSLVERDKARKVYEAIVDSMRDPALLEWDSGNTFKLRVFPVDPKSEKRVVLRYLAPLRESALGLEWVHATRAPAGQATIASFRATFDGKTVVVAKDWTPADVVLPVPSSGEVFRETRSEGTFVAVKVHPDWSKVPAPGALPARRRVFVIVDTSRSMLEEKGLALDALRGLLADLRTSDRFTVLTSDVDVRAEGELVAPTAESIASAVSFVAQVEPDGASDLGLALTEVEKRVAAARATDAADDCEVIYVGDGTPTWGETDGGAIGKQAHEALGPTPVHAIVLGNADEAAVRAITSATEGRVSHPRTKAEIEAFAATIAGARDLRRLRDVQIDAGEGAIAYPSKGVSSWEGDALTAVAFFPKAVPATITLRGLAGTTPFAQSIPLSGSEAGDVAKLWAVRRIAALEAEGAPKDAIVAVSLAHGVMSKETSFLVLESEDAYAQWKIDRKAKEAGDPKVSGGDLESLNGKSTMTPDHLQPGDPELRIVAPEDAQSVVAVLPSGDTLIATWEPSLSVWTVRFLIDKEVSDGSYEIQIRITHADGKVELQKVPFHVDTIAPTLLVTMKKSGQGYTIGAVQQLTDDEAKAAFPDGNPSDVKKSWAHVLTDAKRVEVETPDGQKLVLDGVKLGAFRGSWQPKVAPTGPIVLHVVAVDRALNQRSFDVEVTP